MGIPFVWLLGPECKNPAFLAVQEIAIAGFFVSPSPSEHDFVVFHPSLSLSLSSLRDSILSLPNSVQLTNDEEGDVSIKIISGCRP